MPFHHQNLPLVTQRLVIGSIPKENGSRTQGLKKRILFAFLCSGCFITVCVDGKGTNGSKVMLHGTVYLVDKPRVSNPCCGSPRKDMRGVLNVVLLPAAGKYCHLMGLRIYRPILFGLGYCKIKIPELNPVL